MAALILCGAGFCFHSLSRLIQNHRQVAHTLDVLNQLQATRTLLNNAGAAADLYILAGRQTSLAEFRAATSQASLDLTRLQNLVSDSPRQRERAQRLKTSAGEMIAILEVEVAAREQAATAPAPGLPQNSADSVGTLLNEMNLEEQRLLGEGWDQSNREAHTARLGIVSAGVLDLLIVCIFTYVVAAQLDRRPSLTTELKLAAVADSADEAIFVVDLQGIVTSWNHGAERMYGYSAKEMIGRPDASLCRPSDVDELDALLTTIKQGKRVQRYETVRVTKDGNLLPVAWNAWPAYSPQGKVAGACIMSRDIAAQKQAEQALRRSEEQYRVLFTSNPQPMWVAEATSLKFLAVNDAAIRQYGYSRDEFLAISILDILPKGAVPGVLREHASPLNGLSSTRVFQHRKKDGSTIDAEVTRHSLSFQGQAAILMLAVDVTERRLSEVRLQSSEQKFAKAFHSSPLGVTITTRTEGRYLDANETFLKMLGYTREQVIGKTVFDLKLWANRDDRERMLYAIDRGDHSTLVESVFTTRSGDSRSVQVFAEPLELDGVHCVLAVTHDVTERRHLENQLRQAQKMEAVGRLAGGVAHDFNNMLGVIGGYTELIRSRILDDVAQRHIDEISKAVGRAASLTRQLLAFSRKQVLQPRVLDINERIRELGKMLLRLIGDDIELIVRAQDILTPVEADPGQIDQVILNLVVNARDAMPKGGKLIVETGNVRLDSNADFQQESITPGLYVMLAVSDTGCGMDPETLSHIFEPFFTTKEQGKGTGLGLSTVHGIVNQSDGYIWVASQPGNGSTFKVYLPVAGQAAAAPEQTARPRPIARGSGTILLVEDEEPMRKLTMHLLEEQGYVVLEACDGEAAIDVAKRGHEIHVLLTDVVMPRLSGPGLADRIRGIHPKIGVVYMSGYTDELLAHHGALGNGTLFLEKPFTRESLIQAVQNSLAGPRGSQAAGGKALGATHAG